jgi:hypothetical protein
VNPLRQNVERVNHGSYEEPRLRYDFPDLVQIAESHEQNARRQGKADYNREEMKLIDHVQRDLER